MKAWQGEMHTAVAAGGCSAAAVICSAVAATRVTCENKQKALLLLQSAAAAALLQPAAAAALLQPAAAAALLHGRTTVRVCFHFVFKVYVQPYHVVISKEVGATA